MGIKNSVFVDNSTPQCDADFLNSVRSEINNIITNTGQTAATSNLNQLGIASAIYASGGDFYTDSGAADAYVLSAIGSKSAPTSYFTGMRVRFVVGASNTGASTVNVASLGVKNIKGRDGSTDPGAGDLAVSQIVDLTYDGTNFVISAGVPYTADIMPIGTMLDYAGTSAPSGFLLCYGQEVSRSTYANLFSAIGTAFGVGDGSSTFNIPDCRGRTKVGLDNLGGSSADRITSANADSLNNTGFGSETDAGTNGTTGSHTLTVSQIPAHTHAVNDGTPASGTERTYSSTGSSGEQVETTTSTGGGTGHTHPGSTWTGTTGANAQPSIAVGVIIKI